MVEKTKQCGKCGVPQPVDEFVPDRNEPDGRNSWCSKCRIKLGRELSAWRTQAVVGKLVPKTSIGEDLLSVLASPVGGTLEGLLDGLAGLVESTSAARSKNPDSLRTRLQHAPLPRFEPAWAEHVQGQVDDQLWQLSESVLSFLNRPTDPKTWAACDACGNRRIGESTYCQSCGNRILAGARRCRLVACPNEGRARRGCPKSVPHPED